VFSDDFSDVAIAINSITLSGDGIDEFVVDTFTVSGSEEAQISVLILDGGSGSVVDVVNDIEVPAGTYNRLVIDIAADDPNLSYVQDAVNDMQWPISSDSNPLSTDGISLAGGADENYTLRVELAQALQFRDTTQDYLLDDTAISIINNVSAAQITGQVDATLFDQATDCNDKEEPNAGNRVYLYAGLDLDETLLADFFTTASSTTPATGAIAPLAVSTVTESRAAGWEYSFDFIPQGSYTLAFTCKGSGDDPVEYDALSIPLPATILRELAASSTTNSCNLSENTDCTSP